MNTAEDISKERAIRAIVSNSVELFASEFSKRHISEHSNPEGTINQKINNVFIAALGPEIQYYSALSRSLDSSLGNMIEKMAISIARLSYTVVQHVEGVLSKSQTEEIAKILEEYRRHARKPHRADYTGLYKIKGEKIEKRHESDYYLYDEEHDHHYLIELKIGGDLDVKKARSEKEALLEQFCILTNSLGHDDNVSIVFATAYNRYGEGRDWNQTRVKQFFASEELCISRDFWNLICKMDNGYEIVIDEYKKKAFLIVEALEKLKTIYLGNDTE